ncbi:hypothetical protein [Microcella humidisoli]|jgi:hypothetical protein|uniref:Uncharacterized protein n=1 Tax=Microcella humidisoli TaxID=2963406 RepID=A0ABY5FYH3_9MICO|nr:hypothetical protein [Microcella humidisoli]UTT63372.1 hypothetical protein NNL39_04515 [Microcella humidisoli]
MTTSPAPRPRFVERHRTALAVGGLVVSLGLAVLWLFVVPERAASTTGVQSWLIRFGHSICWALLATTAALVLARATKRAIDVTAWAALAAYAAFLAATLL